MDKIRNPKNTHEEDWKQFKSSIEVMKKRKDISKRMFMILNVIKIVKPKRLLDVGCGIGYLMYLVKEAGINPDYSVGIDISQYAASKAKKFFDKVYVLNLDQEDLPPSEENFDLIVCSDVLEHLYDVDHALKQMRKTLSPEGKLLITVPNYGYFLYRGLSLLGKIPPVVKDPRHISAFTLDYLLEKCRENGFTLSEPKNQFPNTSFLGKLFKNTLLVVVKKTS